MENKADKHITDRILGVIIAVFIWLSGVLFSGEIYGGDVFKFSQGIPLLSVLLPIITLVIVVFISVLSKKNDKKNLFMAMEVVLFIPIISYFLTSVFLPSGGATNIVFGFIGLVFMTLQIPFSSAATGFYNVFNYLPFADTFNLIFAYAVFPVIFFVGLVVYFLTKTKK